MRHLELLTVSKWIWAAFGVYWMAVARSGKPAQTRESPRHRPLRLAILVITFTLLFSERTGIGILGQRFVLQRAPVAYGGFALTLAGLAIAVWARVHLGRYWSDKVVLKVDHQLIRTGPYAYTRHPIYFGVLLALLGTVLIVGQWRGVLAFLLLLTNYSIKALKEERILATRFGETFDDHKRHSGFLLPRFRP